MDTRSFYGSSRLRTRVDDSCLSENDDEDPEYTCTLQGTITRPSDTSSSSSSEDEEDDDASQSECAPSSNGKQRVKWTKTSCSKQHQMPQWQGFLPQSESVKSPIEYFREFFDEPFLEHIVRQSNLFSVQKNPNKPLDLTRLEFEQFLGTVTLMPIRSLPRTRLYWSADCRMPIIADVMSQNRWEEIKANPLFNNDSMPCPNDPHRDRLFKVLPLIDLLLPKFESLPQDQALCVDEQMVPFKGRSSLKQYIPNKPHKWGYKIFVLCDSRGIVHSIDIYTGKIDPVPGEPDTGASENIVLKLAQVIQPGLNHLLFCDNWFTSLKLLTTLAKKKVLCLGTVWSNRLQGCPLPNDASLKKEGRGAYEEFESSIDDQKLIVVKWFANRAVTMASTFAGVQPVVPVERWDRSQKKTVNIDSPCAVQTYNKFMGGGDLNDCLIAHCRIHINSKKFYLKLFFHFINLVIVVCWLLYRRDCKSLGVPAKAQNDLLKFRINMGACLLKQGKATTARRKGRPSSFMESSLLAKKKRGPMKVVPVASVRADSTGHWPVVKKNSAVVKATTLQRSNSFQVCQVQHTPVLEQEQQLFLRSPPRLTPTKFELLSLRKLKQLFK